MSFLSTDILAGFCFNNIECVFFPAKSFYFELFYLNCSTRRFCWKKTDSVVESFLFSNIKEDDSVCCLASSPTNIMP